MPTAVQPPRGQDQEDRQRAAAVLAAVLTALGGYTAVTAAVPSLRLELLSPDVRIIIEVLELCGALAAATALWLGAEEPVDPARGAFISAMVALATSNAVFIVAAILLADELALGGAVGLYSWLVTRYAAGVLFIFATLRRPQLRVSTYLIGIAAALTVGVAVSTLIGDRLPRPFFIETAGHAEVAVSSMVIVAVVFIPAVLFAVGAWMAWRVYVRSAKRIYFWLSLALWVQVFSKAHELLYPTMLGSLVTSSDVLRAFMVALLLVGALLWLRGLSRGRRVAIAAQENDLRAQEELLARMLEFLDREQAFRSIVVHELATPIATLRAFVHTVANHLHPQAPSHARDALDGMQSETGRLQQLVGRMDELRWLELEEFECHLRPTKLKPLLDDVASYARGLPGEHPVAVHCDNLSVMADPLRLGQALRNVVTNAARYSPPESAILIRAHPAGPGLAHISVVDHGPGIPGTEHQRVLGKYKRGSASRGTHGTGLGLYVACRIAEAHDGRILLGHGDETGGARVTLELRQVS